LYKFNFYRSTGVCCILSRLLNPLINVYRKYQINGSIRGPKDLIGFTTTCAISACHYKSCEFESRSWQGDKVCQWLATSQWFSLVSSNKTDHHDITEILLKVALNTITLTLYKNHGTTPAHCMSIEKQMW
jgi:hypothetical protein